MYLLFRYKNKMPMESYKMGRGERIIARAFMRKEVEERKETIDNLNNSL